jgi:hypothetical protein
LEINFKAPEKIKESLGGFISAPPVPPSHVFLPRKLEVRLLSLLEYREDNDNTIKKYSWANG